MLGPCYRPFSRRLDRGAAMLHCLMPLALMQFQVSPGLMDFLYQPDREIIALAHPDLALTGLGGTPVARAAGIPAMNAV